MTAPLPPLPPEVRQALDDLIDRVLEVGHDPLRVVEGAEAYAVLVRAIARALDAAVKAEREACAKVCDEQDDDITDDERTGNGAEWWYGYEGGTKDCAAAIRARGEATS